MSPLSKMGQIMDGIDIWPTKEEIAAYHQDTFTPKESTVTTYGPAATSAYGSYQVCHTGPVKIMQIGNSTIWAGRHRDMDNNPNWSLRVRFRDAMRFSADSAEPVVADEKARAIMPEGLFKFVSPPTMDIDWPDFSTPDLLKTWWEQFVVGLRNLPPDSNVGMYCEGGHGRTGTAMSILAALTEQTDKDPVAWLRKRYCDEAVESWRQIDYIEEMTGAHVASKPAFMTKNHGAATGTTAAAAKNSKAASYVKVVTIQADGSEKIEWVLEDGTVAASGTKGGTIHIHEPLPTQQTSMFNTNAAGDIVSSNGNVDHKALVRAINKRGSKRGGKKWRRQQRNDAATVV